MSSGDRRPLENLRPLLPASNPTTQGAVARSRQIAQKPLLPKRKTTEVACLSCRKRKVKCNGATPQCSECLRKKLTCEYVESPTEAARNLKRRFDESQIQLRAHEELYSILASRPDDEALAVLQRIRRGNDLASVLRQLKEGDLLMQIALVPDTRYRYTFPLKKEMPDYLLGTGNPYLTSLMYEGTSSRSPSNTPSATVRRSPMADGEAKYRIPYHAAEIVEPRIDSAKPSEWTVVPVSDEILRELLRAYFHYEYPLLTFFNKDHFLDDMVAKRQQFCSPLLVNAVLAAACHSYRKTANRNEFWNPESLQYQFSAEARRLREMQTGQDSLSAIHATLVMSNTRNLNGIDQVGWLYTVQAVEMANRMQLFDSLPPSADERLKAAWVFTAWALFCWQAVFCFHFFRSSLRGEPPKFDLPDPAKDPTWYPENWILYPSSPAPIPIHLGDLLKSLAKFRTLMNDIGRCAFPEGEAQRELTLEEAQGFYLSLDEMYKGLPDSLSIKKAVFPCQLSLHLHYYNVVISLLEPFTTSETQGVKPSAPLDTSPQQVVIHAKICLETIFRSSYVRHGSEFFEPVAIQYYMFLGFMTLNTLAVASDRPAHLVEALQSTLALVLKVMRDHAKNSYLSETVFRILKDAVANTDLRILRELEELKDQDLDRKTLIARHVQSHFPVNIASINQGPEERRVGDLVAAYRELEIEQPVEGVEKETDAIKGEKDNGV